MLEDSLDAQGRFYGERNRAPAFTIDPALKTPEISGQSPTSATHVAVFDQSIARGLLSNQGARVRKLRHRLV